jgi:hypothetical protein
VISSTTAVCNQAAGVMIQLEQLSRLLHMQLLLLLPLQLCTTHNLLRNVAFTP